MQVNILQENPSLPYITQVDPEIGELVIDESNYGDEKEYATL